MLRFIPIASGLAILGAAIVLTSMSTAPVAAQSLVVLKNVAEQIESPVRAGERLRLKPRGVVPDGLRVRIFRGSSASLEEKPQLGIERVGDTVCWLYDSVTFPVPAPRSSFEWVTVISLDRDRMGRQ